MSTEMLFIAKMVSLFGFFITWCWSFKKIWPGTTWTKIIIL